ncbi:MAG: hypothetical protein HQL57_10355 [Magnetococcales bacterium]|nr:hypothetical protein [Magnetococcales bacterium]MBF0157574.1 hypothetical protein [Magnetococcales bacterium]
MSNFGLAVSQSLAAYAVLIVVSTVVAYAVKFIVSALATKGGAEAKVAPLPATVIPALPSGIPAHHLVIIAAAAAEVSGRSRIVRIDDLGAGTSWASSGRSMHQASHAGFRR